MELALFISENKKKKKEKENFARPENKANILSRHAIIILFYA